MAKLVVKQQAIELRQLGYSYNLICDKLHIPKSTLSGWVKRLPCKHNEVVERRIKKSSTQLTNALRKNKLASIANAKIEAVKELPNISKRDLWMLGLGLYIGEGKKTHDSVRFVNSDPQTIILMIRWFREIIGLENENFRPSVHIYPDNDELTVKKHWAKITNIPITQFAKTQIDTRNNKSETKKNSLKYGTLHIAIIANGNPKYGVFLFRKIMFWAEQAFSQK